MPVIRTPGRRVAPGGGVAGQASAEDFGAGVARATRALGNSLQEAEQVLTKVVETKRVQELNREKAAFANRVNEIRLELQQNPDFDARYDLYQEGVDTALSEIEQRLGPRQFTRLSEAVQPIIMDGGFKVRQEQIEGNARNAIEGFNTEAEELATLAASNNPVEREYAQTAFEEGLTALQEGFGLPDSSLEKSRRAWDNKVSELRRDRIATSVTEMTAGIGEAARAGDRRATEKMMSQADALIEEGKEAGAFTPEEASLQRVKLRETVIIESTLGDFERVIQSEGLEAAESARDVFERERIEGLRPEARDAVGNRMEALLNRERARVNRIDARERADMAAKNRMLGERVSAAERVREDGELIPPEMMEQLVVDTQGTEYEGRVRKLVVHGNVMDQFALAPPLVRDEIINSVRSQPYIHPDQHELLLKMEASNQKLNAAINDDPLGLAIRQGIVPELPAMSELISPDELASLVQDRREAASAAGSIYGTDVPVFTKQEAALVGHRLQSMPASERVQWLGAMVAGGGSDAPVALASLDKQKFPVLALMGGFVLEGAPEVAETVARGQDIMASDPKVMPPKADIEPVIREAIGPAFIENSAQRVAFEQATLAAYAALSQGAGDVSGAVDMGRIDEAIELVTGGIITHRAGLFGARSTFVTPARGLTENGFQQWFNAFTPEDVAAMGGVPGFSDERALELIKNGELVGIGRGRWLIYPQGRSEDDEPALKGPNGDDFLLEWPGPTERLQRSADTALGLRPANTRQQVFTGPRAESDLYRKQVERIRAEVDGMGGSDGG